MIEIRLNDRLGKTVWIKVNIDDTIGDVKKVASAYIGTRPEKIQLQRVGTILKDHITLEDYEISDGVSLDLYYN